MIIYTCFISRFLFFFYKFYLFLHNFLEFFSLFFSYIFFSKRFIYFFIIFGKVVLFLLFVRRIFLSSRLSALVFHISFFEFFL